MMAILVALAAAILSAGMGSGRALFQFGVADPPILSGLPGDDRFATGSPMACAACHGASGEGSAERTPVAPLARVAATAANPVLFARALERGIAGDGHAMRLMPRYAMTAAQRGSLAAYLIALEAGSPLEPGLSDTAVVIDVHALAPAVRREVLDYALHAPQIIYGRTIRFSERGEEAPFAQIVPVAPAEGASTTPSMVIASSAPGAGRAAVIVVSELFRRSGRRLTQPGFAAILEALEKQEVRS